MKRYKVIFDQPDNVTPPATIGFQTPVPTGKPAPNHIAMQSYVAPVMPVAYCGTDEDGRFVEVMVNTTEKAE